VFWIQGGRAPVRGGAIRPCLFPDGTSAIRAEGGLVTHVRLREDWTWNTDKDLGKGGVRLDAPVLVLVYPWNSGLGQVPVVSHSSSIPGHAGSSAITIGAAKGQRMGGPTESVSIHSDTVDLGSWRRARLRGRITFGRLRRRHAHLFFVRVRGHMPRLLDSHSLRTRSQEGVAPGREPDHLPNSRQEGFGPGPGTGHFELVP